VEGDSPPQLRRGGAERRGGAGQLIRFIERTTRRFSSGFALSGSRFAAAGLLSKEGKSLAR